MAIAPMTKVMIASYRTDAGDLLESLQTAGIIQVLDAQRAMVSKEWPELHVEAARPRNIEELISRLGTAIDFLKQHATEKDNTSLFNPLLKVTPAKYATVIKDSATVELLEETEKIQNEIAGCTAEIENSESLLEKLIPWKTMDGMVEDLSALEKASCLVGLIPTQHVEAITAELHEIGAVIELVGEEANTKACIVACMPESSGEVYKKLRNADFDAVNFEGLSGSVPENISSAQENIKHFKAEIEAIEGKAAEAARDRLSLQILFDHQRNLLGRETTKSSLPATDNVLFFEGWAKEKDYKKLEKIVGKFGASSVSKIEATEDEEPPVEIDNNRAMRPFEVITRLYGMPKSFEFDPTTLLAPFFAIFFALCLTDAGYAIVIMAACAFMVVKMQGDKKLIWLLAICSVLTIVTGALTGGWFGDGVQQLVISFPNALGWLGDARMAVLKYGFDPLERPMIFFAISCGLGYFQIMIGLLAGMIHNFMKKDIISGVCDQFVWIWMINCLTIFGAAKMGAPVSDQLGSICGKMALVPAGMILFFSERKGSIGARLGMGAYNLFSTIFYLGDVLSYLRLMALGMVTGGLAMAINVMARTASEIPYVGIFIAIIVLIGGHLFNTAISALSAFVHTIRLQFVEFFPKFMEGGGREFKPLTREYKYVSLEEDSN